MKWMLTGLTVACAMFLCNVAQAQTIYYENHGKRSSWGVGLSFGPSYSYGGYGGYYGGGCGGYSYAPRYYSPPAYYYAPPPVYYYAPPVAYHAHDTTHEYSPWGHRDTTTYHYGPVHPTYQSHYYWP